MAIQSQYTSQALGLTAPEAYTKLTSFHINNWAADKSIALSTETFFNASARQDGKQSIGNNDYQMPYSDGFTFEDIYTFIKEQEEFTSAFDV